MKRRDVLKLSIASLVAAASASTLATAEERPNDNLITFNFLGVNKDSMLYIAEEYSENVLYLGLVKDYKPVESVTNEPLIVRVRHIDYIPIQVTYVKDMNIFQISETLYKI